MTARLFVDVDETLITHTGREWRPNLRVVRYVRDWHAAHPDGEITVWSMQGAAYATRFGANLLHGVPHVALAKWPMVPGPDDEYIDDAPLATFAARTLHPMRLGVA